MALLTAVAGPYTATYNPGTNASGGGGGAQAQGITADDGFRLVWTIHKQRIGNDGTDQYGMSHLESVYRGMDFRIVYRCREYSVNNVNAALPYGKGATTLSPVHGQAGRVDDNSGIAGALVLTAASGTPASTNPATLTAAHAVISDNTSYDLIFTSKLRELPVSLDLIPYVSGGPVVWFTTT